MAKHLRIVDGFQRTIHEAIKVSRRHRSSHQDARERVGLEKGREARFFFGDLQPRQFDSPGALLLFLERIRKPLKLSRYHIAHISRDNRETLTV